MLAGDQAKEVYLETVSGLTDNVERAEEKLAEAQEQIAEYQTYVNDGSYQSYFKVDEYQAIYDENLAVLKEKMEEWGVSWEQVTGGSPYSYESILDSLYGVLEQNLRDLDQAKSDYEDAVANAAFELQTLELQLPSLQQAVAEAKETYEIQAAQELTSDRVIYMYSDTQEMSVTVSVAQTDIAKLVVGDEAYIMDTGGNGYSGVITAINPVTASESRTNVTYNVTVSLTGDTSALTANQSVTVIFGVTQEEIGSLQQPSEGVRRSDGEEQPGEGVRMPDGEEQPGGEGQRLQGGKEAGDADPANE